MDELPPVKDLINSINCGQRMGWLLFCLHWLNDSSDVSEADKGSCYGSVDCPQVFNSGMSEVA